MALNRKTMAVLSASLISESVLDGGPAKSKQFDRHAFNALEQHFGGVQGVRRYAKSRGCGAGTFMEAEWVATDQAIYYVHFNAGLSRRWPWEEIEQVIDVASGGIGLTRRIELRTADETVGISLSRRSAHSLIEIAKRQGQR